MLLLTDPIDEFMLPSPARYKDKKLEAADHGSRGRQAEDAAEESEKYRKLLEHLKGKLPEVSDVRLSSRLKESARLPGGRRRRRRSARDLERWLAADGPRHGSRDWQARSLELNGDHPAVQAL